MINDKLKGMIREYNPWWEGSPVKVPAYRRHLFAEVQKYLKTKQILAIVGLRRVGKTVLMRQIIEEVTKSEKKENEGFEKLPFSRSKPHQNPLEGVESHTGGGLSKPSNVFYFLFDDLIAKDADVLEDVLDYYLKTIAQDGRKYVFLDEIQKVPYWQDILKRLYDTKENIKFVVSGSASLHIKKSKESLAGRIFDFYMPPLTFGEFAELNGFAFGERRANGLDFGSLKKVYEANLHKKHQIDALFSQYILKGGFPEIAGETDIDIAKNYIRSSVLEKIIFEDIPEVFEVKRKDLLYSILEYCAQETANLLDVTKLSDTLNENYHTVKTYLFYLQHAFLLDIVYNHSASIAKQLRKNKKAHITHPSITIAMMRYAPEILEAGEVVGRYVESIVFQHSKLMCERISFWRTPQKEEVDLVLEGGGVPLLPIEVKYRRNIDASDLKALKKFMEKFKVQKGIVVTHDLLEEKNYDDDNNGKTILFIPAWLFLLACSSS